MSYTERFTALTLTISDDGSSAEPNAPAVRLQQWKKVTSYSKQPSHMTSKTLTTERAGLFSARLSAKPKKKKKANLVGIFGKVSFMLYTWRKKKV